MLCHGLVYCWYSWATLTRSAGRPRNTRYKLCHAFLYHEVPVHDEADTHWWKPVEMFKEDPLLPHHALAMIQPWHPAMMWIINMNTSQSEMILHRQLNQPSPACGLERSDEQDALMDMHGSVFMSA